MQLFPERDRQGRRLVLIAVLLSLFIHFVGGSLWAFFARLTHQGGRPEDQVVARIETITVDLTDRDAIVAAVRATSDTTHLFYAALSPDSNPSVEAERNGQMLGNLLDGLNTVGAPLRRVISYEGFKIYGIHLGANVRTPARESDPPHMPPNIYLSQRAQLRKRASAASWDNVALVPDVVVGDIFGTPIYSQRRCCVPRA